MVQRVLPLPYIRGAVRYMGNFCPQAYYSASGTPLSYGYFPPYGVLGNGKNN